MLLRFLRWLAPKLELRRIHAEDGSLYLDRFKLFGWMPGDLRRWPVSIYLHRFHRPDMDEAPHSHPWRWAISLVLCGAYLEERVVPSYEAHFRRGDVPLQYRTLTAGRFNVLRSSTFHRISQIMGPREGLETWTLIVVGPKVGSWGFWVPGRGIVPWRERLRERGMEVVS